MREAALPPLPRRLTSPGWTTVMSEERAGVSGARGGGLGGGGEPQLPLIVLLHKGVCQGRFFPWVGSRQHRYCGIDDGCEVHRSVGVCGIHWLLQTDC